MIKPNLDRIRLLVDEEREYQHFYTHLLEHVVETTDAQVGLVWDCSEVPYQIVSKIEAQQPVRVAIGQNEHTNLLVRTSQQKKCVILRPRNDGDSPDTVETMIFLCPIHRHHSQKVATEILEIVVGTTTDKAAEDQAVAYLTSIAKLAAEFKWPNQQQQANFDAAPDLASNASSDPLPTKISIEQASDYMDALHSSIDKKKASSNVANETRRLLDCDRVSVLNLQRGKFVLTSISGQVSINRRSNTTKLLEKLSRKILATGQAFWYPEQEDIPPQIGVLLDEYLSISATRSLIVEPVYEKNETKDQDPESLESKRNRVIGGIVYEHCNHQWAKENVESAIGFATVHSANAIRNANRHQNLFLYPLWRLLGQSKLLTAPRIMSKLLLALAGLVAVCLILAFWQTDFYVVGEGEIVPVESRNVFATVDGVVDKINVKQGDSVAADQILASLNSENLQLRHQEAVGQLNNLKKRLASVQDDRFQNRNSDDNTSQATQENVQSLQAQIDSVQNQIEILNEMTDKLIVRSPIAGKVATWDVEKRLLDRPIQIGEVLLEIADTEGPWKLELEVEDKRIGHLTRALAKSESGRLPITFLLAADPSERLEGEIVRVGSTTELTADNKQVIKIDVEIDAANLPVKHAGTGVTAKIICGRSSMGYLWLHDVYEFLNKNVFFRFAS